MMNLKKSRPHLRDAAELQLPVLADDPRYAAVVEKIDAVKLRMTEAEMRRNVARARARALKTTRTTAELADALVLGGQILGTDPSSEVGAADQERRILRDRLGELEVERADIVATISFEMSQRLVGEYREAMGALAVALRDAGGALEEIWKLRARVSAAGCQPSDVLLSVHPIRHVAQLPIAASQFLSWASNEGLI